MIGPYLLVQETPARGNVIPACTISCHEKRACISMRLCTSLVRSSKYRASVLNLTSVQHTPLHLLLPGNQSGECLNFLNPMYIFFGGEIILVHGIPSLVSPGLYVIAIFTLVLKSSCNKGQHTVCLSYCLSYLNINFQGFVYIGPLEQLFRQFLMTEDDLFPLYFYKF